MAAYRADYTRQGLVDEHPHDGVPGLLADLRAAGVRLAIATSKAEPTARRILEHFGIAGEFGSSPNQPRRRPVPPKPTSSPMRCSNSSRCPNAS